MVWALDCASVDSVDSNKAIVQRWYQAWQERRLDELDEQYAPDWIGHFPGFELRGPQAHRDKGTVFSTAFPDAQYTVEALIAEGDLVASRYTMRATHQGELRNIPPTGRSVVHTANNLHRIAYGKIAEQWSEYDYQVLLQQLA